MAFAAVNSAFSFGLVMGNALSTRPAGTAGTTITPGTSNSYGSYATLLSTSQVSEDAYGLWLFFNGGFVGGEARDMIATIGIDPAGGTSYTDTINHLLVSCAESYSNAGRQYYFPIWIKAGSSVGVKASVNSTNAAVFRCIAQAYGRPSDQRLVKVGTRVETLGATPSSSSGTSVTPGTTSEGTWTQLGTLTNDAWWFQCGFGINNAAMALLQYHMDLSAGDASNKHILLEDILVATSGTETVGQRLHPGPCGRLCKAGDIVYGRMQCSGTADSGISMAAYALS